MKQLRHQAIRDLVGQRPLRTQQELEAALAERGIRATQATLSRDIAELGLTKVERRGAQVYAMPGPSDAEATGEERLRAVLRELPYELRDSGTLLIVKTLPGSAHAIAAALDRTRWADVIGTVAGDDTVFIATPDLAGLKRLRKRLEKLGE